MRDFADNAVKTAFAAFPEGQRKGLLALRALIFNIADENSIPLTETLKWVQPAYLAPQGSTLRLGLHKSANFALFAHCQSRIISNHAAHFGQLDRYDGNRAILFEDISEIDHARHGALILHGLTYHMT